jgi:hypothetical protein
VVDVAADHTVHVASTRLARDRRFEVTDVADCALDLELEVARQAPVRQAQTLSHAVEPSVGLERELIGLVAQVSHPLRVLDHAVEQITVRDPQLPTVGSEVDAIVHHVDAAEAVRHVAPRELVVVAGHEDDMRALARLAQQLLHHVVVRLRPVPAALELPAVDDVAHQVQGATARRAQEVEQGRSAASRGAQVQVGNPDRTHVELRIGVVVVCGVVVPSHGPEVGSSG